MNLTIINQENWKQSYKKLIAILKDINTINFNNKQVLHYIGEEQRYQHIFLLLNPFIHELRCMAREAAQGYETGI